MSYEKQEDLEFENVTGGKQINAQNGVPVDPENDYCMDRFEPIDGLAYDPNNSSQRKCKNCKHCAPFLFIHHCTANC